MEQLETIITKFEEFLEGAGSNHTDLSAKELRTIIEAALKTIEYQPVLGTLNSAQSTGEIGLIKDSVFINLIARLESHLRIWNDLSRVFRDQRLLLQQPQLRKKFGSLSGTIRTSTHFNPPRYALSEEEFFEIIYDKEVYATFETFHILRIANASTLNKIKKTTKEILTRLEEI